MKPHQLWSHSKSGVPIKHPSTLTILLPWEHPNKTEIFPKILKMVWWLSSTSFGWVVGKNKTDFILLDNHDQTLLKGAVLNNDLAWHSPCFSPYDLHPSFSLTCTCNLVHFMYMQLPVHTIWWALLGLLSLDSFQIPCDSSHTMAIDLLMFNPDPEDLFLLPPN